MTGRPCSVCQRTERRLIDTELVSGTASFRAISRRFGLSKDAVSRHAAEHLPANLIKAQAAVEVAGADDLLGRLLELAAETRTILSEARGGRDNHLALQAIARAEKQLELQARLLHQLEDSTMVNVAVMPEWLTLRDRLVEALMPYPEALQAVAGALAN